MEFERVSGGCVCPQIFFGGRRTAASLKGVVRGGNRVVWEKGEQTSKMRGNESSVRV